MSNTIPEPPEGISQKAEEIWHEVLKEYELDADEMALFREAVLCKTHADALESIIAKQGRTFVNSHNNRHVHPALIEARHQRMAFLRMMEKLRLVDGRRASRNGKRTRLRSVG